MWIFSFFSPSSEKWFYNGDFFLFQVSQDFFFFFAFQPTTGEQGLLFDTFSEDIKIAALDSMWVRNCVDDCEMDKSVLTKRT